MAIIAESPVKERVSDLDSNLIDGVYVSLDLCLGFLLSGGARKDAPHIPYGL